MDRRSWPWKKKSSDKSNEKTVVASDSAGASLVSAGSQRDQEHKKVNYVQISMETYSHLTGLEDQVKTMEDQIKELNEKLSFAHSEMTTKDNLVKQHAKVAEEAVSGWEKAEAEALALKHQFESVTLLKLTAEDRASHLDGALKECMRQIRNVKEEHDQKLHDVVLTKTKQWDKIKLELESKIVDLDQELLRSSAENSALSRSLQEHSDMLMKISEEKSQAETEIEILKGNIQSFERETNSLKYELHVISKELEIRNEEKNMSIRSAEVANKQHLEGVKKIAKLEAESQRLRGLVRKKLPGPAALAQMRLEVENLGRDYAEPRLRKSPVKSPSPHLAPLPEFSIDNTQQCHKETEFLTARLLAMEEETKMLKEALAKRNSELQASRNLCAKTNSKLRSLEAQVQNLNQQRSSLKPTIDIPIERSLSQNASNPPSLTSMSEDGIDEEGSCAESWATALISELSHFKKERSINNSNKADNTNHLELMDDFLEMERLACLSTDSNGTISVPDSINNKGFEYIENKNLVDVSKNSAVQSADQPELNAKSDQISADVVLSAAQPEYETDQVPLSELRSRISMVLEAKSKDGDVLNILEDIKRVFQDAQGTLSQQSVTCNFVETHSSDVTCNQQSCPQEKGETAESLTVLKQDCKTNTDSEHIVNQELAAAISLIHDFVISIGKKAMAVQDTSPYGHGLIQKFEEFSSSVNKVLHNQMSLVDFILDLSCVFSNASELSFSVLGYKGNEAETNISDCIDKVTLLENKVIHEDSLRERFSNSCSHISRSSSHPEVPQEVNISLGYDLNAASCKCLSEEVEQLKLEKDKTAMDLARCTENLKNTESHLQETEQLLLELKSELASCQKSNSLAETQLKCMAESYKSLETRAQEFEAEVILLREKTETLGNELQDEKRNHQDALARCKDLEEKVQRNESCLLSLSAEVDIKTKQEREIKAAAEKLAECQETIFILGKQLKALHPSAGMKGSSDRQWHQTGEAFMEEPSPRDLNPRSLQGSMDFDQAEMCPAALSNERGVGSDSPSDLYGSPFSPSDTDANVLGRSPSNSKHPKPNPTKSNSFASSALTLEKNSRGFSRFFSSKGKNSR